MTDIEIIRPVSFGLGLDNSGGLVNEGFLFCSDYYFVCIMQQCS